MRIKKTKKSSPDYQFTASPKFEVGDMLKYVIKDYEDIQASNDHVMVLKTEPHTYMDTGETVWRYHLLCIETGKNMTPQAWYIDFHYEKVA